MSVTFDVQRLVDYLDGFGEQVQEALRPAAAAGAKVLYDRVKINVAGLGRVTGNLDSSIYRVLKDLRADGYNVGDLPASEEGLIKSVLTAVSAWLCWLCWQPSHAPRIPGRTPFGVLPPAARPRGCLPACWSSPAPLPPGPSPGSCPTLPPRPRPSSTLPT